MASLKKGISPLIERIITIRILMLKSTSIPTRRSAKPIFFFIKQSPKHLYSPTMRRSRKKIFDIRITGGPKLFTRAVKDQFSFFQHKELGVVARQAVFVLAYLQLAVFVYRNIF